VASQGSICQLRDRSRKLQWWWRQVTMIPKYSIVCPAYNVETYIDATIQSILAQTEPGWELIIVDDGSTDGTVDRVRSYPDRRIQLIRQANSGPSAARNAGIAASRGERLLFLDSDDLLHPTAIARLGAALDVHDVIASYGQCRYITEDGEVLGPVYRPRRGYPPSGDVLPFLLNRNLFVNGGHVCMQGAVVRGLGGFRADLPVREDHEYWCRLAARGPVIYIGDDPVLDYRVRSGSQYRRMGRAPDHHARVVEAIFGNPELTQRFSPAELRRLRRGAEAWSDWLIAGEYIRSGDWAAARPLLVQSLSKKFDIKRAGVLFFALCGGAPRFAQKRFPDVRKYDFLVAPSAAAGRVATSAQGPRQERRGPDVAAP